MVLKYDAAGDSIGWWSTAAAVGRRYPLGIAVDAQEHVLVATATWSVVEYPPDGGTPIDEWTSYGYGGGQFSYPWDITLDAHGDFYVTDANRDDVQKFGDATVPVLRSSWGALKRRFR